MKYTYRVILLALITLGITYADSESQKKDKDVWKYKPLDLCKFPVFMDTDHCVRLKEQNKLKIELKQVRSEEIGKDNSCFPCYKGSDVIKVKTNFPATFLAWIDKNPDKKDLLKEFNLYFENDINTIKGTGQWEELTLCLEAWNSKLFNHRPDDITEIGEIIIQVRYHDDVKNGTNDDKKSNEPQFKTIDICKFPLTMDVGHYIKLKECYKCKIELKQVGCEEIGKDYSSKFPCFKGSDVIQIKANFPAIFSASIKKNPGDEDLMKKANLYFENGVNTIKGCTGDWEDLKLNLEVYNIDFDKIPDPDKIQVGEITIKVRPPDDPNYRSSDDSDLGTKDNVKDDKKSKE